MIENLENIRKNLKEIGDNKLYIVDDNCAVSVSGNNIKIVSQGTYYEI